MRHYIDLVTEAEDDLRYEASMYANNIYAPGDPGYIDVDDAHWREVHDYPLARLRHLNSDWEQWFADEQSDETSSRHPDDYADMLDSDIREPVIVYDDGRQGWLWDGWHRVGASFVAGRTTIPAIVGTKMGP